ncbi:MAG: SDR family oxidoreductase [Deltaproteobacteria bacterium]|nr:SDR family oxidoreductase [Deltaproteobacteria bacterium]MCW5803069.1 SDR family oxidoreductase [Deltaproteobacteria bacterium]
MRSFVTGANRGIGKELVRQLLARGDEVEAGVRDPDSRPFAELASPRLRVHRLDVTSDRDVAAVAAALGDAPLDLVINNAGIYGGPRQSVAGGEFDFADAAHTFDVNTLGALRVSLALLPNLRRGTGKKLAHISSGMGSIGDNTSGGTLGYRMSKAALNMLARTLAVDLRADGIISVAINPGWVKTSMGGPSATTSVEDSVRGVLQAIDGATLADSGEFLDWRRPRFPSW